MSLKVYIFFFINTRVVTVVVCTCLGFITYPLRIFDPHEA